jgi:hypothetical protein
MVGQCRWSGDFEARPPELLSCLRVSRVVRGGASNRRRSPDMLPLCFWSGDFEARAPELLSCLRVSRVVRGGASNRRRSPDMLPPRRTSTDSSALFLVGRLRGPRVGASQLPSRLRGCSRRSRERAPVARLLPPCCWSGDFGAGFASLTPSLPASLDSFGAVPRTGAGRPTCFRLAGRLARISR